MVAASHGLLVTSLRWGLELGTGLMTFGSWSGQYPLIALAMLLGPAGGALLLGIYGLVRGAQVPVALVAARDGRFVAWLRAAPDVRIAGVVVLAVVLIALLESLGTRVSVQM